MTENELKLAAIQAAKDLKTSMDKFSSEVVEIKKRTTRSRRLINWLALSVAFDVMLSIGLGWATYVAIDASSEARKASSEVHVGNLADYQSCLSSNIARKAQVDLWDNILGILANNTSGKNVTNEENLRTEGFREYYHTAFAQRECVKPKGVL